MFKANHFINTPGIHPFQLVQTIGIATGQNPVQQTAGPIFTECPHQHFAHIVMRTDTKTGLFFNGCNKAG